MRIIILSDLHITAAGLPIWNTDTTAHFDTAINYIREMPSIDAIFIIGDVADNGSQWAYDYVRQKFDSICIPAYFIPGNHDNIQIFNSCLQSQWCHTSKTLKIGSWKFILLSSVLCDPSNVGVNMSYGYLSDDELSWFKQELNTDNYICVILHHPPIEQKGWLNRKLLQNRTEFNEIIKGHKNVKLILYGHTHYHSILQEYGVTYICSPSTGFAFNANLPKFQIDEGNEAILIIDIEDTEFKSRKILL